MINWALFSPYYQLLGHSGEYGNAAKLVGKMSKSVMWLISIHFLKLALVSDNEKSPEQA